MNLDSKVDNEIFRKDHPIIIARNRQLASIVGARLAHDTDGYLAGQVVARDDGDGLFYKWSAASGGTYDTVSVLLEDVTGDQFTGTTGNALARSIVGGEVFYSKLIEIDATAITQMKAKVIYDATGEGILKY